MPGDAGQSGAGASGGAGVVTEAADAHLIRLCREYCTGLAVHVEMVQANASRGEDSPAWTSRTARLGAQITATPATTQAGVEAKIKVLRAFQREFVPPWEMSLDRMMAGSIAKDVVR